MCDRLLSEMVDRREKNAFRPQVGLGSCSGGVNVGFYFDFLIVVLWRGKKPYNRVARLTVLPAEADVKSTVMEIDPFGQEFLLHPLFLVFRYQLPVGMKPVFQLFGLVYAIFIVSHPFVRKVRAALLEDSVPPATRTCGVHFFSYEIVRSPMVSCFQDFKFAHL